MNIRLKSIVDTTRVIERYTTNNVTPAFEVKTRFRCALEALINLGKALNQHLATLTNPENKKAEGLKDLYLKRATILSNSVLDPKANLPAYLATFAEGGFRKAAGKFKDILGL